MSEAMDNERARALQKARGIIDALLLDFAQGKKFGKLQIGIEVERGVILFVVPNVVDRIKCN